MLLVRVGKAEGRDGAGSGTATTYAVDIGDAQEIIGLRRMTRLPGAPPCVRGLINVRGAIVTVLDLGMRLDAERSPVTEGAILLVRRGARLVGIVVDQVVDVRRLDLDDLEPVDARGIVRGMTHLDDAPVVVLDLDGMIKQVLLS
jgi:purine-binding chemotaxis protein CheW